MSTAHYSRRQYAISTWNRDFDATEQRKLGGRVKRYEQTRFRYQNAKTEFVARVGTGLSLEQEENYVLRAMKAHVRAFNEHERLFHLAYTIEDYPEKSLDLLAGELQQYKSADDMRPFRWYMVHLLPVLGHLEERQPPKALMPKILPDYLRQGYLAHWSKEQLAADRQEAAVSEHPKGLLARKKKWQHAAPIGVGGQGFVNLWVKVDAHNTIKDRCIIKDTYVWERIWDRAQFWAGNVSDVQSRTPMEVQAMKDLETWRHVAHLRSWENRPEQLRYRMYLEFYPYLDLQGIINKYIALKQLRPRTKLPEPFIWWCLEGLVAAGLAMQDGPNNQDDSNREEDEDEHKGSDEKQKDKKDGNDQEQKDQKKGDDAKGGNVETQEHEKKLPERYIVHRDVKPPNVFFGYPTPGCFEASPTLQLGDFGLAIKTSAEDSPNPAAYWSVGHTRSHGSRATQ